jgi:hypothetical protein
VYNKPNFERSEGTKAIRDNSSGWWNVEIYRQATFLSQFGKTYLLC